MRDENYDGHGSTVGDTTVVATTPDVEGTSVYAFTRNHCTGGSCTVEYTRPATGATTILVH
ncbi:MAG: hypothetical protein ACLQVI_32735 [Polyangiaceae bacterium]